ncbi:MAG TPA: hypothetical protein VHR66_32585 [Gemmataceae bacterium]|jgi:hypothetical protein|nr:hypothetical protein [Gemmataceae bacterium]
MCRFRYFTGVAAALSAVAVAGCDPGYTYTPVDANGQPVSEWATTIAGVKFSVTPSSILIGSSNEFIGLDVVNGSAAEVVVVGAEIETNGRALKANLFAGAENTAARTVDAGQTGPVSLLVELGGPAGETFGLTITYVWHIRIGSDEHTLRVPMNRQR